MTRALCPCAGVDGQHVHFAPDQLLGALGRNRRWRRSPPPTRNRPWLSLAEFGYFSFFWDVLDGDEALEGELVVHHQQFFDAVLVQDGLGLLEGGATGTVTRFSLVITSEIGRSKRFSNRRSRLVRMPTSLPPWVTGTPEMRNRLMSSCAAEMGWSGRCDGIHDHAAFTALDAVHLFGLPFDGHVAMDDSDAALLRQRDRQVRLRDGVHGGGDHRNVQCDLGE